MTSDNLIDAFLEAVQAERSMAYNTCLAYGRDLRDLAAHLSQGGQDLRNAAREDVEAYFVDLTDRGIAASSRARKLSAIRQFFRFAVEENWRRDNPVQQLPTPRKARPLPKLLSVSDVDKILAASREFGRSRAERCRNACLFELLYATGMRVSELGRIAGRGGARRP